jgi:hypothetical protein
MDKTLDKLPELVYDLLSIFIPGLSCYCAFNLIFSDSKLARIPDVMLTEKTFIEIGFIYILGHVVNSCGNFFVPKVFGRIFGHPMKLLLMSNPKRIHQTANGFFLMGLPSKNDFFIDNIEAKIQKITNSPNYKLDEKNIPLAYEICRNYVMENSSKRGLFLSKEQAYGEMSRSMIFISLLIFFISIFRQIFYTRIAYFWEVFIIALIFLFSFTYRYLQSRYILPYYVYLTTCLLNKKEEKNEKEDSI